MTQAEKARLLLELHRTEQPLVLPNAWDAASARIFEDAGFPAIATTSAGIANSLGYADIEQISRDEMMEAVARIVLAVPVPVTADVEAGYGDPSGTARLVIEAGAAGMNLEDSTSEPALVDMAAQCEAIRSVIEVANGTGVPLVVNARTDAFWIQYGEPRSRMAETIARARAYASAGAHCVFVPGFFDEAAIGQLVTSIGCPLNLLPFPQGPSIARMGELGVARITVGSGAMRATMGLTQRIARELRQGETAALFDRPMSYAAANKLFQR